MKIKLPDFKITAVILAVSAISAILYNSFNYKGLPLIAEQNKLNWAADSLLTGNSLPAKEDSIPNAVPPDLSDKSSNSNNLGNAAQKADTALNLKNERVQPPSAITVMQALRLYKSGKAVFIDARDKWDFADGHIKGAVNIPQVSFDMYHNRLDSVPKDAIIVTYCSQSDCELSEKLAHNIFSMGYKKVFIFKGGWEEWVGNKLDTEGVQ